MSKKRLSHSPAYKAKVALAALKQEKTLAQLAAEFHLHPNNISKWKSQLLENAETLFQDGRKKITDEKKEPELQLLYEKIGRLEVENDFLKKKSLQFS